MKLGSLSLAIIAANALAVSAWAHHSHGNYQLTEYTHVTGTVKEIHLINPHSWIYIEIVDAAGEPTMWAMEATGPRGLARAGITRDIIDIGDTVSARCHQLKDGSNGCLLGYLTTEDGIEREWD